MNRQSESGRAAHVTYFERLLAVGGHPLGADTRIMDFGCGDGALVRELAAAGYERVAGCDFAGVLGADDRLRAIETPYRVPFGNAEFDCVLSNQVLEHVQNYPEALQEIRRVLAPGGVSLHLFPPRYLFREPHVFVPLATVIQNPLWLRLWARLGIRNQFQIGKQTAEVATLNRDFLRDQTTYFRRAELLCCCRQVFPRARLLEFEQLAVRTSIPAHLARAAARPIPRLATLWTETHGRALLLA